MFGFEKIELTTLVVSAEDRHFAGGKTAPVEQLLALSCFAASGCGAATGDAAVVYAGGVWTAAKVELDQLAVDSDTTAHTLFREQMRGRNSYNPKNKGKKIFEAYEKLNWKFIVVARKTSRLVDELKAARWNPSPGTDADGQCEFFYKPGGWGKAFRFLALRYEKEPESGDSAKVKQYQLLDTPDYTYRVFVPDMDGVLDKLVLFRNQRQRRT